jgi:hypothetical protein
MHWQAFEQHYLKNKDFELFGGAGLLGDPSIFAQ